MNFKLFLYILTASDIFSMAQGNMSDLYPRKQLGIGSSTPNISAKLEINSTSKRFLPPRITGTVVYGNATISSGADALFSNSACQ